MVFFLSVREFNFIDQKILTDLRSNNRSGGLKCSMTTAQQSNQIRRHLIPTLLHVSTLLILFDSEIVLFYGSYQVM